MLIFAEIIPIDAMNPRRFFNPGVFSFRTTHFNQGQRRILLEMAFIFSNTKAEDGSEMWNLVRESKVLDLNSPYSYLMMSKFFSNTSLVARSNEKLAGFVTAFHLPQKQDTLFVWQIGVEKSFQGKGLGTQLLRQLLHQNISQDICYLEATISPSNLASQALFRGIAKQLKTTCEVAECFGEELFPGDSHEKELLFRIGPIKNFKLN